MRKILYRVALFIPLVFSAINAGTDLSRGYVLPSALYSPGDFAHITRANHPWHYWLVTGEHLVIALVLLIFLVRDFFVTGKNQRVAVAKKDGI